MTIEIKDFDPAKDQKGKIKGKLTLDGQEFEAWFQKAEDIPVVQATLDREFKAIREAAAQAKAQTDEMNSQIAAKDAQIAAINREIEDTKAKIKGQAALIDRLVAERLQILADAARIFPNLNIDGLNNVQVMAAVVQAKHGETAIADRSDDYIRARFDFLADAANAQNPDPFAAAVKDGLKPALSDREAADKAYEDYVRSLNDSRNVH